MRFNTEGHIEPLPVDADAATVRSLSQMSDGNPARFARHTQPSLATQDWIAQLNLEETNGLLIHVLRRWHSVKEDR